MSHTVSLSLSLSLPPPSIRPRSTLPPPVDVNWQTQITVQHNALTQLEHHIRSLLSTLSEQRRAIQIDQHRQSCTRAVHTLKSRIQQLQASSLEQDTDQDTHAIETMLEKHIIIEQDLSASIGRTLLACQRNMALQSQQDRKELLQADSHTISRRLQQHATETALDKSREFGSRLQDTKKILSDQIKQSEQALKHLADSTSVMSSTGKVADKYSTTVNTASSIITRHKRRELTDKILMWVAIICFCLVVTYIWKRRVGRFLFNPLHVMHMIQQVIMGNTTTTTLAQEPDIIHHDL